MSNDDNPEKWLQDLDRKRRSIDLRLDREGRWWHDGQPFDHPRLIGAFNRGLALHEESREPILRVGTQWCYIHCEDTPFIALRAQFEPARLVVTMNTEERVQIPTNGLTYLGEYLYALLEDGRLVRFNRAATASLAGHLTQHADRFVLTGPDGTCWPIDSPSTGPQPA